MVEGWEDSSLEEEGTWPRYRCMVDERHYYLISSPTRFVELQRVGRRWFRYEVDAKLYPEQMRVADMLACAGGAYRRCDPSEWSAVEALVG